MVNGKERDHGSYDRLIDLVYEAASEPLRLKHAISAISEATGAAGVHLHAVDKRSGEVVLSSLCGFPPIGEIDYMERYAKIDPRVPIATGMQDGHWFSCHHHLTQSFVDSSEFYQDFLIPYGSRYLAATRLLDTDSYAVFLGVHTGPRDKPIEEEALSLLRRLTPHLQRSMRIVYQHSRLRNQWAVVKATLDSFDYAALVCDANGELLVANESACALLEQNDGLSLASGKLRVSDPAIRQKLHHALDPNSQRAGEIAGTGEIKAALLIPRRSGLPGYQMILRQIEPERSVLTSGERLWSLTISDPVRASVPTARAVSMLYGLTPAESRLATHLIAGASPEAIAEQGGVKIATIRSQLSSLFAKTGTRRQSELVRLFGSVPAMR